MQLTLREATEYLRVSEGTLRRWIKQRGLPVHVVNERTLLNAIELWEWATENGVPVDRELLERARASPDPIPSLSAMLETGGIHHDVPGTDRSEVLREVVRRLPLPPEVDREFISAVMEAREAMGSTGIGDGIAIPHVRNPILLRVDGPQVTLCLLREPIEFEAVDGRPVYALFTVISPTVPGHLRILARLGYALHDASLKALLAERADAGRILACVREIEAVPATGRP